MVKPFSVAALTWCLLLFYKVLPNSQISFWDFGSAIGVDSQSLVG